MPAPTPSIAASSDETNARNFPGLNFSREELAEAARLCPCPTAPRCWWPSTPFRGRAISRCGGARSTTRSSLGADALDPRRYRPPRLRRRHPSGPAPAPFGAGGRRQCRFHPLLCRGVRGEARRAAARPQRRRRSPRSSAAVACETEVFVFGGLCVMAEGRCSLSSYATGLSPNMNGVCSPASHVAYREGRRHACLAARRLHHQPVRSARSRRLSDALQGAVPHRAVDRLCLRGPGQSRRCRTPAGAPRRRR